MSRKIVWFISLVLLLVPLFLVSCGEDENIPITNISDNSGESSKADLAVGEDNGLHLVWFDFSTGINQIMYSEKMQNNNWTVPFNISDSFSNSRSPRLVVDSQGIKHAVWHEYMIKGQYVDANGEIRNYGKFNIFYSQKPEGGVWSEKYNVTDKREASTYPSLALDSQGTVHLVWEEDRLKEETELYYTDIYYSHRNTDGTWTEAVNISFNDGDSTNPEIAVDSQGNIHVIWEDDTSGSNQIFYAVSSENGEWSQPVVLSDAPVNQADSAAPVIAVDSLDTLHVAWNDLSMENYEILYSSKPAGGSWSQPVNVSRNNSNSGVPDLAVDGKNNVHLVWNDDSPGNFDIFYKSKPGDGDWGRVENISRTQDKSGDPSIAVDSKYNLHFAWSEYITNENNWDIVYTTRSGNGG